MLCINTVIFFSIISILVQHNDAVASPISPYINYTYFTEMLNNVADLWWNVDEATREIVFELHVKTTGWIALGVSPGKHLLHRVESS